MSFTHRGRTAKPPPHLPYLPISLTAPTSKFYVNQLITMGAAGNNVTLNQLPLAITAD